MAPTGRTSIKGKTRKPKKYVREQYTYEHRLATINYLARTGDMGSTIDRFLKSPTGDECVAARVLIQGWKTNRATIELACQNPKTARSFRLRPKGKAIVLSGVSELRLVSWINDLRRDGVPVCTALLRGRALEIAAEQGIPSGQFRASKSWIGGFLQRHRLSFRARTHHGQRTPADAERTAREFALEVQSEVRAKGIVNVVNADQTGVNFELVPRRTVDETGTKTVWVRCGKKEKARITVMVTGDIFGNKYRVYTVMKTSGSKVQDVEKANKEQRHGFGRGVWKEVEPLQDEFDMQIYANKTAWWNADISLAYLDSLFGHRTPASAPIMLLLDHFSGHWTDEVVARATSLNIIMKKIPAGLTWRAQPADVAWIKGFKDAIRRSWVDDLRSQRALHRQATPTATFSLVPPDRRKVASWIAEAWAGVRRSTIIKGFARCGYIDRPAATGESTEEDADTTDASDVVAALVEHGEVIGRPLTDDMDIVEREQAIESDGEEEQ